MKFGARPRKVWNSSTELAGPYNRLHRLFERLMMLDHLWTRVTGEKSKFWKLVAVKGNNLQVSVQWAVARTELLLHKQHLLAQLNKHFDKPWIENIEIVKEVGNTHE